MTTLDTPLSILGGMSANTFLRDYWQKKPLLIRAGLSDFEPPLEADELAGMAMESEVESRIVIEQGKTPWQTIKGPFTEDTFAQLPDQEWTLLIQAVDHWVPEVQELKERFHFLPSWRLDDVMVSYATKGGSVGPHYDQYDVFLVQVSGKRRWQVLAPDAYQDQAIKDIDLHILSNFKADPEQDWELEAGDILYLPPNFAHNGRALDDDCMTYSIGFRAPSMQEVLTGIRDQICEVDNEKHRFSSPSDHEEPHHAEIHHSDISYLQQELKAMLDQPEMLADWLGTYMSEVKYPEFHGDLNQEDTQTSLEDALKGVPFFRPGDARICYHANAENKLIQLYCNGAKIEIAKELEPLVHAICDQVEFDFSTLETDKHKDILPMLSFLISKQGVVHLPAEE